MTRSGGDVWGRTLAPGEAVGELLVLHEPLSLWGGMDPHTGRVVDRHHPQHGESLAGRVVVLPGGRGSSSSSSVLAEAIRAGTGPVAILLRDVDPILALGSLVAAELYGLGCPVVVVEADGYERLIRPVATGVVSVDAPAAGARAIIRGPAAGGLR